MREVAIVAALMPGFGDPLKMPIDDFSAAFEQAKFVAAVTRGMPMSTGDSLEAMQ